MSTPVLAPVAGSVIALSDVPDPVFAQQIVGSGVAIDPERAESTVVAPADGRLLKLHPHAFVLLTAAGKGLLVHLGIDTVQLEGDGFELLVAEGDEVTAGTPIVRWDPAAIEAGRPLPDRAGSRDGLSARQRPVGSHRDGTPGGRDLHRLRAVKACLKVDPDGPQ